MSPLERRCRLLLCAYPAAYREARGEEIIGTLLEATPAGRSWPLLRDVRCLISGGLRARAAQPRQFTTAANLRVAALAGIAAYLAFSASAYLSNYVRAELMSSQLSAPAGWPLAVVVPPLIPMALAWRSRRRLLVLVGALPAAAAIIYAGPWQGLAVGFSVVRLACLAALVALAGYPERPGWRWCWPVGLLAAAPLLLVVAGRGRLTGVNLVALVLALSLISVVWMVIDARPAIAMAVFLLAIQLPITIGFLAMGDWSPVSPLFLLIVIVITAVAVWRVRRQSARGEPA
jgi:hypothetical protein